MAAPDQIAWGLSLDAMLQHGSFSYKQLIHYPHEGGSFLISIIAIILKPFNAILPALSIAALLVDACSRWIQIKIAEKLFGQSTAVIFAVWTVFAVPLLLPWGTVNFGLHSLASFLPFIFIYIAISQSGKANEGTWCGIAAGLSITFAYDNLILIPAFLIWKFIDGGDLFSKSKVCARFLGFTFIALLPHISLRMFAENGFQLEQLSAASIRGVVWNDVFSGLYINKLLAVINMHLPASFFLSTGHLVSGVMQRYIVIGVFVIAIVLLSIKKIKPRQSILLIMLLILIYTIAFAASPFYSEFQESKSYVYFRHFAFIIPLISLIIIHAFVNTGKMRNMLIGSWLVVCSFFSITYIVKSVPEKSANYEATGWVLARKYGDQPEMLKQLKDAAPAAQRNDLLIGFGWGLTATLLTDVTERNSQPVNQLKNLYSQFPSTDQPYIRQGFDKAFSAGITPVLDKQLQDILINQ